MAGTTFINHKGTEICLMEYPQDITQLKTMIAEAKRKIASKPPESVRALSDLGLIELKGDITDIFKEFTACNKPYIKASALVGITGIKKVIVNTVAMISKRKFKIFNTVDEAKDYLASA